MIVSNRDIASYISKYDSISIFIDLEVIGKKERQGHLDTVKSSLSFSDVAPIRKAAPNSNIIARINPFNNNTQNEINSVIKDGVNSIMLPMFKTFDEVKNFIEMIDGRAKAIPLFETSSSINILPEIVTKLCIEQLHIGLNDLHIDQEKSFLFEPLSDGFLEEPCALLRKLDIKFGIGGIAKAGEGLLSPEFILGEHVRLGSSVVILSRTFHKNSKTYIDLINSTNIKEELQKLENIYSKFQSYSRLELENNKIHTWNLIKKISKKLKKSKI